MSVIRTWACDVCGVQKQTTNHWWLGFRALPDIIVHPWNEEGAYAADAHLCGIECTLKWVGRQLEGIQ